MLLSEHFGDDDGWSGYNEMTPRLSACGSRVAAKPKGDGSADEGPTKDADARLAKRISTMALVQRAIVGMSGGGSDDADSGAGAAARRSINLKKKKSKEEAAAGGGADARMDNDEYEKMMSEIKRVNEYAERRVRTQTARVTTLPVRPGDEEDASSKEGETPKRGSVVKRAVRDGEVGIVQAQEVGLARRQARPRLRRRGSAAPRRRRRWARRGSTAARRRPGGTMAPPSLAVT